MTKFVVGVLFGAAFASGFALVLIYVDGLGWQRELARRKRDGV